MVVRSVLGAFLAGLIALAEAAWGSDVRESDVLQPTLLAQGAPRPSHESLPAFIDIAPLPGDALPSSEDRSAAPAEPAVQGTGSAPEKEALPGSTAATLDQGTQRAEFLDRLAAYERELEPELSSINLASRDAEAAARIEDTKRRALDAFLAGKFDEAVRAMMLTTEFARQAVASAEMQLATHLAQARIALELSDAEQAFREIEGALRIKREDPDALALLGMVAMLDEVLWLLEQADRARAQRDLDTERNALRQVLQLDPTRSGIAERVLEIDRASVEQAFSAAINGGLQAAHAGDLDTAERDANLADAIDPARPETEILWREIEQLRLAKGFDSHIRRAEALVETDDWKGAQEFYEKALSIRPHSPTATRAVDLAQRINRASETVDTFLGRLDRLRDERNEQEAREHVQAFAGLAALSPSLDEKVRRLGAEILRRSHPVAAVVRSDNQTEIVVRGVGKVGRTIEREIKLKPGEYWFEGKRDGYRSKLIRVTISPDEPNEIVLVCDEVI